jgi:glycosyltransferase involved in cell wall biosynthesis
VIASDLGSLPELVTPETGILLKAPRTPEDEKAWVEELAQTAGSAGARWSAEACRDRALAHFHYLKMAEGYENAYKRVIGGASLHATAPVTQPSPPHLDLAPRERKSPA